MVQGPAVRPCGSCPYRRDVPAGVWDRSEYAKLPAYDADTVAQPAALFLCHQQDDPDGRLCAGWVGCHDMDETLAVRLAAIDGRLDQGTLEQVADYVSPVPLFASGAQAAEHGMAGITDPAPTARRTIDRLAARAARRRAPADNQAR